MAEKASAQKGRFRRILSVLLRNKVYLGLTPLKLRLVIEQLGPTFVKLGQIMSMRPDVLPPEYCRELESLRTSVPPMPYTEVLSILEDEYKQPPSRLFSEISQAALGSASIAQVHSARLLSGEQVVLKVQRRLIRETMESDLVLIRRASRLTRLIPAGKVVDIGQVLDEMWKSAQEELDFRREAANLRRFAELNRSIKYVGCPSVISELTTSRVLVMEYIDGIALRELDALRSAGYDLNEIGEKLADNFVKQVIEDLGVK